MNERIAAAPGGTIALGSRALQPAMLPLALEEVGSPRLSRAVVAASAVLLLLFGLWAAFTRMPEIAVAQGAVATDMPVAPVQHLEGGQVEAVLVTEGAQVAQGQPLLRFASAIARTELDQLRAREASLRFQSARLRAFLARTQPAEEDGSFAALAADQKAELEARLRTIDDRQEVLRQQLEQRRADRATIVVQLTGLQRQVVLHKNELRLRERLLEQGLTTRLAVLDSRRAYLSATAETERLAATAEAADRAVAEAEARLAEADSAARDDAGRDVSRVHLELAELNEALSRAFERVSRLTVLAPATGVVKGLAVRSHGAVVPPGAVLMEIVPSDAGLLVEARISPRDIGFLHLGQSVVVKVQAFDYARYGTLEGTLAQISATTTPDDRGEPWYAGRIALAAEHVGHNPAVNRLKPGMTVQADIVTGGKTLLQYLLKPVHSAMSESFRER
jgi:HlyD family secretion protein/adhesin transport system membrane fusion protein